MRFFLTNNNNNENCNILSIKPNINDDFDGYQTWLEILLIESTNAEGNLITF